MKWSQIHVAKSYIFGTYLRITVFICINSCIYIELYCVVSHIYIYVYTLLMPSPLFPKKCDFLYKGAYKEETGLSFKNLAILAVKHHYILTSGKFSAKLDT